MKGLRGRAAACWIASILTVPALAGGEITPTLFDELKYRHIGPMGNRVTAVVGVAGDANVYYVGAAAGGIFKTVDGGAHWQPIFDGQPAASIGALAVAPSDSQVVWAGTGETFLRANVSIGNGIYKSTDGGKTWRHMGLTATGRIARVVVHPENPDVVYVAALGHCYGPQPERGVYRTRDGGETWQQVLYSGRNAGASDLVMDPTNPRILFAGMWQMRMDAFRRTSGGPESGLWVSRDGGEHWTRLEGGGLPRPPWGKIGLTMSAADPRRVYALIETSSNHDFAPSDPFQGVLWRSDDGGESWAMISADNNLAQRPLYYSRALAAPDDADEIHFMAVRHSRSLDGGVSVNHENQAGWDHHDIWIDPLLPERMIVGHDGGVSISANRGESWFKPQLPIAQMYHANVDDRIPYFVYGNRQDGPSAKGPSNSLTGDAIPIGAWSSVGGCEVGFAVPNPVDPDIVWTGCYDGILERFDARTGHARDVSVWPVAIESWPAEDLVYRFQWTYPIAISPHDPRRVYVGSQYVHLTDDEGQSWSEISPDLTTADPDLQRRTGGLTLDDAGPTLAPTIFALAESPLEEGLIWAGTNDGQVQLTRDAGATWSNVTANLPDLPPLGTISNVEPSRHAAAAAYLTVDRHQLGDTATYVYKTADHGETWRRISAGVPQDVFAYAHCVREDPKRPGLLYLGVENGVYVSFDEGERWHSLQSNLPRAPVHWLTIQERFNDLVVATYGRGFWILDDLTALQQLDPDGLGEVAPEGGQRDKPILFEPRPAYRFHPREPPMMQPDDPAAGTNPTYGASIHLYIPPQPGDESAADTEEMGESEDQDAVVAETTDDAAGDGETAGPTIAIIDATGAVVRTLEVGDGEGLRRIWWDLKYDKTEEVKLRTRPLENPHVGFGDDDWRELVDGGRFSLLAPPGVYTVHIETGGKPLAVELTVLKDPGAAGSAADLDRQMDVVFELRGLIDEAAKIINEIEWARKQLVDLEARLSSLPEPPSEVIADATALSAELRAVEGHFFDLRMTQGTQDTLRWKRLLYSRLMSLARSLTKTDFPPTDSQLAVFRELKEQLQAHRERFRQLREVDIPTFNEHLREQGIGNVVVGKR